MNLAQKIAVAVTLLVVAVFLLLGGHKTRRYVHDYEVGRLDRGFLIVAAVTDNAATFRDVVGILLTGGAATVLLGIRRKRPKDEQKPES
jgi:hypothetical protein